jgi:putative sigma-54 modulation protein
MVDKMERQIRERRGKVIRKRAVPSSFKTPFPRSGKAGEGKEEGEPPRLIQRKRTIAKPMSVEEALSQLSLSKKDFLAFINSDSGQMNVVYRSKNGGYGWVEPHPK